MGNNRIGMVVNMTHCMVDLETIGTGTMPVMLSIGAVKFDPCLSG